MKIVPSLVVVVLGVAVLGCSTAHTQVVSKQVSYQVTPPVVTSEALKKLEAKLREMVLKVQPKAVIELKGNSLKVSYAGEKPEGADTFSLLLQAERDIMYHRPDAPPLYKTEPFGITLRTRVNLKRIPSTSSENDFVYVPMGHWTYPIFIQLTNELGVWNQEGRTRPRPMTRYEFAVGARRCLDAIGDDDYYSDEKKLPSPRDLAAPPKLKAKPVLPKQSQEFLDILKNEFIPEISRLGGRGPMVLEKPVAAVKPEVRGLVWQPRYEYLSLQFSYGTGVDRKLVEDIRRVVMDYSMAAN